MRYRIVIPQIFTLVNACTSLSLCQGGKVNHVDFLVGKVTADEIAGLEFEAVGQSLQRLFKHLLMVKCQWRQLVDGEPACQTCIVTPEYLLDTGEGEIGNRDDAFAWVAVGRCKGAQLLNIGYLEARLLKQFAPCPVRSVLRTRHSRSSRQGGDIGSKNYLP